jgi:putative transposase
MARLLVDVLAENRRMGRFLLHGFVIMPNHFHLLLTPPAEIPLEKALQFIKGGFCFRAKRENSFSLEIWRAGLRKTDRTITYIFMAHRSRISPSVTCSHSAVSSLH